MNIINAKDFEVLSNVEYYKYREDMKKIEWKDGGLSMKWGGYDYWIAEDRLDTPEKLLGWVQHLSGKIWMNPLRIRRLVEKVSSRFGWKIYGH